MNDRELLELAAKAAGMTLTWGEKYRLGEDIVDCTDIPYAKSNQPDEADMYWNPLTDDGDALRLAVRLRISLVMTENIVDAQCENVMCSEAWDEHSDPQAATRRAITRAAAEIGKGMP